MAEACREGHKNIIEKIVERFTYKNVTKISGGSIVAAAEKKRWEIVDFLVEKTTRFETDNYFYSNMCVSAIAERGNLEILKMAKQKGLIFYDDTLTGAIKSNNFDVIKYAAENIPKKVLDKDIIYNAFFYTKNYEIVKFLLGTFNISWKKENLPRIYDMANFEQIQELSQKYGMPTDNCLPISAAEKGDLELLKFCVEKGIPFTAPVCGAAAKRGHLEILKWLFEEVNCPRDRFTCENAVRHGNFRILKYAREQNCPWVSHKCLKIAWDNGFWDIVKWIEEKMTEEEEEFGLQLEF